MDSTESQESYTRDDYTYVFYQDGKDVVVEFPADVKKKKPGWTVDRYVYVLLNKSSVLVVGFGGSLN